jgi:NAD(P)-dependent dehydrogenase (short-subunit alcohol dehydrogenase family)
LPSEAICSLGQLRGRVAVVTGASSGIGRAIALSLAQQGVRVCAVGRNSKTLDETVSAARHFAPAAGFKIDLTLETNFELLASHLNKDTGLDILVHSAGVIHQAPVESAHIAHFDCQYVTNVRAPYLLTQQLLPYLKKAQGEIVFINSSVGLGVRRPEVGQYAATKHALKAVADSLREEVNPKGIRVLTVYLGRTATPMQEALYRQAGGAYRPESLLQPQDVASMVVHALMLPRTAEVTDISIRPLIKPSPPV